MNANPDRVPPITGYAAAKWHVRSNGIEFVVMDQNCNTIATCRDRSDADFIAAGPELYTALRTLLNRYVWCESLRADALERKVVEMSKQLEMAENNSKPEVPYHGVSRGVG